MCLLVPSDRTWNRNECEHSGQAHCNDCEKHELSLQGFTSLAVASGRLTAFRASLAHPKAADEWALRSVLLQLLKFLLRVLGRGLVLLRDGLRAVMLRVDNSGDFTRRI